MDKISLYEKINQNVNCCLTNIQKHNYKLSQGKPSYSTHNSKGRLAGYLARFLTLQTLVSSTEISITI